MKKHLIKAALLFLFSAGGAQAQTGNFGIGTTAPASRLSVVSSGGSGGSEDDISLTSHGATPDASILVRAARGTEASPSNLTANDNLGTLWFMGRSGGAWHTMSGIDADFRGSTTLSNLRFLTSNTERVRIDENGNVGVGTSSPGNVLEVSGTGGTGSGLKLPTGAASGKVLTSDGSGNASWQTGYVVSYSEIHGTGNNTDYAANVKLTGLSTTTADNVKTIYGSTYGWDNVNKRWVAPVNGKYRVTINGYFNNNGSNVNPRIYAYKNGTIICGIVSVTQPSGAGDIASSTAAIISLNAGDWVEFRAGPSGGIRLYMGDYHTFIRVESVE